VDNKQTEDYEVRGRKNSGRGLFSRPLSKQRSEKVRLFSVKGIVHPKMKILSSFTHTTSVKKIFLRMSVTKLLTGTIHLGSINLVGLPILFKISCVKRKKEIHTGLVQFKGE